jgi:hypothetical protein
MICNHHQISGSEESRMILMIFKKIQIRGQLEETYIKCLLGVSPEFSKFLYFWGERKRTLFENVKVLQSSQLTRSPGFFLLKSSSCSLCNDPDKFNEFPLIYPHLITSCEITHKEYRGVHFSCNILGDTDTIPGCYSGGYPDCKRL